MSAAPLPTTREEAWRYAAVDRLTAVPGWQDIAIGPGETWRDCIVIEDGPDVLDTDIRRLRVTVGEAERLERHDLQTEFGGEARDIARSAGERQEIALKDLDAVESCGGNRF